MVVCDDYRQTIHYYIIVDLVVATAACVFPETASPRLLHVPKLKKLQNEWLTGVVCLGDATEGFSLPFSAYTKPKPTVF